MPLNLMTLMHDNSYHPRQVRDDNEEYTSFKAGAVTTNGKTEQWNPIPAHLVVPRDPINHTFGLGCKCSGCLKYKELCKDDLTRRED